MEDKEMEGYTHEEFCALLDLMQVRYVTRDPLARSPKERMKIINYFRSAKRRTGEDRVQEWRIVGQGRGRFLNEI